MDKELVFIAPTQIKKELGVGNIYNLTIADFYTKARRFAGLKVFMPFLWNVNGIPLMKQMKNDEVEVTSENIQEYTSVLINSAEKVMNDYFLDFDISLRDDEVESEIVELLKTSYLGEYRQDITYINECLSCGNIFGSDPSISTCKNCGERTVFHQRKTLFKTIQRDDIETRIDSIQFFPQGVKRKLEDFLGNLPERYDLVIEKNRKYTLGFEDYQLDPRFITIMLSAILNKGNKYGIRTYIHGDVVKKIDYYALCYLTDQDIPTRIASHGLLLGKDKKKLRWQNNSQNHEELFAGINNKVLRAYFLKHNIQIDLTLNHEQLEQQTKGLTRMYVKINKTLENRNRNANLQGIREVLQSEVVNFNSSIDSFQLSNAFNCMSRYVNKSWKIVKDQKLSTQECDILDSFKKMYFGE